MEGKECNSKYKSEEKYNQFLRYNSIVLALEKQAIKL